MAAEIPDGAVIVARAIMNSSLWNMRPADRIVALTCVMLCNKRPKKWFDGDKQILIDCGQFIGSIRKMAKEANLPMQVVRTSLEHLEKSEFLTQESTQWYTIYTVPKYLHYQDLTKYSDSGVRKPTQLSTRDQHTSSAKINTPPTQSLHNSTANKRLEEKGLSKVSTIGSSVVEKNQHTKNGKSNIKQQQQTNPRTPSSPTLVGPRNGEGTADGVVVVVGKDSWPDPILSKPSFRIATTLLEGIQMAKSVAHALAAEKPLGLVLRVVQQARFQQKPGGWARTALENDWMLPEARGDELREVIEMVKRDVDRANAALVKTIAPTVARLPRQAGESERDWLQRNLENIRSKKAGSGSARKTK